jgi:predicted ATPase
MLKRVSIQNFKSLKDVTLDLQQVNLLIGPNNSGKTNFLKALEYMEILVAKQNKHIDGDLLYKRDSSLALFMHFIFDKSDRNNYRKGENFEHFFVKSGADHTDQVDVEPTIGLGVSEDVSSTPIEDLKSSHPVSMYFEMQINFVLLIYKIDSVKLQNPYPLIPNNSIVHEDASNIVAFLDTLRDQYPDNFNSIQESLKVCIPEFTQIRFQNTDPDGELKSMFGDKTFKKLGLYQKSQNITYWADELSEGTLYFLALLCIINQPDPPKLLLLEEPEKGIHPRRIKEVIEFIRQLAAEKGVQVIMTTHSPLVLNEFNDSPECVFIFDKDDEGATHVKNLQRDVIEPDLELSRKNGVEPPNYTDSLGDSWTIGFLGGVPK